MADLHRLPLRGHDLPCPRPRKARVYSCATGNRRYWYWEHECPSEYVAEGGIPAWEDAFWAALGHVKRCCP